LSNEAKDLMLNKVRLPDELISLEKFGLKDHLLESYVITALLSNNPNTYQKLDSEKQRHSWNFYEDVGAEELTLSNRIEDKALITIPECTDVRYLSGTYFTTEDPTTLAEGIVYRPLSDQFAVGDCVVVNHSTKKVFYIQATVRTFRKHGFKTTTVDEILSSFGNSDYKLCIVGVNDVSVQRPTGMVFVHGLETLSLKEWQSRKESNDPNTWSNADRVETVLARAKLLNDVTEYPLPKGNKKRKRNT